MTRSLPQGLSVSGVLEHFVLCEDFVDPVREAQLLKWLDSIPLVPASNRTAGDGFVFTRPVYEGVEIQGRAEAAAGWPVWDDGPHPQRLPIPAPLQALCVDVDQAAAEVLDVVDAFSSVYVDRYEPGGRFVPHVDRDCYGHVVAGVSLGPGTARLRFTVPGGRPPVARELAVPPRSLYLFFGPIRYAPWHHEVIMVSDVRFAVTFRQPAPTRGRQPSLRK